ncbi:MAG TPA: DUF86 domain-containing protein [Spirochaetota bacterium]|jgi:hypothetical protein|nr:DUF86 domain-containing protein [Spirochaetota bacterium]HPJ15949.1 DUF86 domain-containing protein [Spirochaetota bacterium]HPM34810.1 DUF86 domain-containing protein [Spirochaetota bacterium]HPW52543.1 DUF86 domain-containing protein [Spirochaetota bacterium]HPY04016.1 DUF86 domain-containing protein [Spirochaetota bacterium]
MSEKVYSDYIEDIIRSAELIIDFTKDVDFASFSKDLKTRYAVIRCFEVMGEAAKRIPDEIRNKYPAIPWKIISAMRDRLIHGYDVVDDSVLWKTVVLDLPELLQNLKKIC